MLKGYFVAACTFFISSGFLIPSVSVFAAPQPRVAQTSLHYENYPARPVYRGKPATLVESTAGDYKDILPATMMQGTNFAGHYALADGLNRAMGGVSSAVIVDITSGIAYTPAQLTGYHDQRGAGYTPPRPDGGLHYRANSKLLEIIGRPGGSDGKRGIGHYYYKWENNQLKFLHFFPSPYQSR